MAIAQELKVVVTLEDRRATQGLSRLDKSVGKASGGVQDLSGSLIKLGKTAIAGYVVKRLIGIGKASLMAASDLEESINAVNVVFEGASDIIAEFGQNSVRNVGLARSSFNQLATTTGALLKNAGLPLEQVAENTIELTTRAADLASVFNTDVADASQALGAALRGETEPARRFGITLNEAAIESEALTSGLVKTKAEITEAVKIQARYNIILRQSADKAGDFANTQESFANQTKIAQENVTELGAAIGQALAPSATAFINNSLNPLLEGLTEWINRLVVTNRATKLLKEGLDNLTDAQLEQVIQGQRVQLEYLNDKLEEQTKLLAANAGGNRAQQATANTAKRLIQELTLEIEQENKALAESEAQLEKNKDGREEYNTTLNTSNAIENKSIAAINAGNEALNTRAEILAEIEARQIENMLSLQRSISEIEKFNLQIQLQEALINSYGSIVTSTFNDVGKALVESENKITGVFGAVAKGAIGGIAVVLDALAQQSAALAAFNIGKGIAAGPFGGPFYAAAGQFTLAAAAAATAAGVVRSLPVPELADGGIIPATPGGRLVKVAEAGQAEAVIPLNKMGMGGQTVNYISYNTTQVAGNVLTTQRLAQEVTSYQQQQRRGF